MQPAYDSKAVPLLDYPLTVSSHTTIQLELQQTDAYHGTTGTTLWLGGQVGSMSAVRTVASSCRC